MSEDKTPKDPDCICEGNWRAIVKDHEHLLDKKFRIKFSRYYSGVWGFFGIVHGSDDYYYGFYNIETKELALLTCVGRFDDMVELIEDSE